MLETRDLTIRFGGHVAVDHVSCAFAPGTLTSIVGPNGAGKTTYFNLISGQLQGQQKAAVTLGGAGPHAASPSRHCTHGGAWAGRSSSRNLFPNLSVLENVRLADAGHARRQASGTGR